MFKIGQKVRVIEWLDMPENVMRAYAKNCNKIGEIGIVVGNFGKEMDTDSYDVAFEEHKYSLFFFGPELELLVKVGEQLLLFEL